MPFLVCVLRRLELFAKLRGVLCHHFLNTSQMKWLPQALSRHSIVRYSQESCLQGGVEPQYWIQFRMLNYWLLVSSNLNVGQHLLM